jgi:putative NADH-flavin reductase
VKALNKVLLPLIKREGAIEMNVVLYGATGNSGSSILQELVNRGHRVTAVARDTSKLPATVTAIRDDLSSVDKIASTIAGADVVISAYAPPPTDSDALLGVTEREIQAVKKAGKARLIVVGGAGLLEVAPGVSLIASGHLPAEYLPIATAHQKALEILKKSDVNWTYFSPGAYFVPGKRTGKFRLGTTNLITDANGESRISFDDYAVALVDEIEKPAHERGQMSIGY